MHSFGGHSGVHAEQHRAMGRDTGAGRDLLGPQVGELVGVQMSPVGCTSPVLRHRLPTHGDQSAVLMPLSPFWQLQP